MVRGALFGGGAIPNNPNLQEAGLGKLGKKAVKQIMAHLFEIGSDDATALTPEIIQQLSQVPLPKNAQKMSRDMIGPDELAGFDEIYGPAMNNFDLYMDDAERAYFTPKQVVEPLNNYSLNNKGDIVDQSFVHPSKRSVEPDQMPFEDFKGWREGSQTKALNNEQTLKELIQEGLVDQLDDGSYAFETAVPIKNIKGGDYEGYLSDPKKAKAQIKKDMGLDVEDFDIEFIETDSNNPSHGHAYYQVIMRK